MRPMVTKPDFSFVRVHAHKLALVYLVAGLAMNFYSSLINVDVYHEGDKFPSIVSMSQGGMVFRDVNQMYGFLTTILSIPLTKILGAHLVAMRLTGFIVLLVLTLLFARVLGFYISRNSAIFVAGSWLIVSPSWANLNDPRFSNGFAWPTHYGMLFLFASILLWPRNFSFSQRINLRFFLSSLFMAISWSARLEFIATWVLTSMFVFFLWKRREIKFQTISSWLLGGLTYFLTSVFWLFSQGALQDWYQQTVLVWFSNPPAQPKFTSIWLIMNAFSFLAIAGLGITCFLVIYFAKRSQFAASVLSIILILLSALVGERFELWQIGGYHAGAWIFEISNRVVLSPVNILFATGLVSSSFIIFNYITGKMTDKFQIDIVFLAVINVSLLSMLHITNADYIHMFVMPFVVVSVWFAKTLVFNSSVSWKQIQAPLVTTVLVFALIATGGFISGAVKPLSAYKSETLRGLFDQNPVIRDAIDTKMNTVANFSKDGIWSFCISGLPTIARGEYLGKDKWVWNLEPEPWMIERWTKIKKNDFMYVCALSPGESSLLAQNLKSQRIVKVTEGDGFSIYQARENLV
jgi:hypothetical protein